MFLSFPEDSTTLSSEILSGFVSHLLIRVNLCLLWHRLVELFIATILGLKMHVVGKWHAQCTLCFVWWLLKTFMKFYIKYIWHIDSLVLYINYFYSKSCEKLINLHFTTPLQSPLPLPQNLWVTSQPPGLTPMAYSLYISVPKVVKNSSISTWLPASWMCVFDIRF